MISEGDLFALWITVKLAFVSTAILLLLGTPFAWWLSSTKWKFKFFIEALVALPMILPPTVLGFYLLVLLGPQGWLGVLSRISGMGSPVFTFNGLVFGSIIYSLPFVVQPLVNSFRSIGKRPLEVAATLGASPADRFFSVILPLAKPGYIAASVLGFAHTVGEFGVVLMIGGNIPGETRVVSIAIYDHVEALEYAQAHFLSGILLTVSFFMLISVYAFNRKNDEKWL